jgi:predicted CoA-substrate-specific enzyme activase
MITLGVDVGSLFSKAVVLRDEEMVASEISETTGNVAREINDLVAAVLKQAGIELTEVDVCVSTGTGGDLVEQAEFGEDDVACVAMATRHFLPEVGLSIDIGGQSIATVLSDPEGEVLDFMRNDKCASGSGRFIEVMCGALGVTVEEIDTTVALAAQPIALSTQCGVFAESEIVSHVNQGEPVPDMVAGICDSVASIVITQAMRFGGNNDYTVTGGVGRLYGVISMMQERLRGTYHPFPIDPMLAAAFGAAFIGGLEELDGPE